MSDNLLPCPFCGGPAVNVAFEFVTCGNAYDRDCLGHEIKAPTDEDNISISTVWNTRVPAPTVAHQALALTDAAIKDAVTEYLLHRGEQPYRVLRGGSELWETRVPAMKAAFEAVGRLHAAAIAAAPADWKDDPSADDRWNAGLDYSQQQLCKFLGVDPNEVTWDAATETLDGDVQAVIGNIMRAKFGEDWGPRSIALGDVVEMHSDSPYAGDWRGVTMKVVSLRIGPDGRRWVSVIEGIPRHRGNGFYDGETDCIEEDHLQRVVLPRNELRGSQL